MIEKLKLTDKIKLLTLLRINKFIIGFTYPTFIEDGWISGYKIYKLRWLERLIVQMYRRKLKNRR